MTEPDSTTTIDRDDAPTAADAADAADATAPTRSTELRREKDALQDRLLRTAAEFDNYRKRIDRERRELADYADGRRR